MLAAGGTDDQAVGIVAADIGDPAVTDQRETGGRIMIRVQVNPGKAGFQLPVVRPARAAGDPEILVLPVSVISHQSAPPKPIFRVTLGDRTDSWFI